MAEATLCSEGHSTKPPGAGDYQKPCGCLTTREADIAIGLFLDRSGFDAWWFRLDEDTRAEIRAELAAALAA